MISQQVLAEVTDNTITREFSSLINEIGNLVPPMDIINHGSVRYVDQLSVAEKISRLQQIVMIGKRAEAILQL